MASMSVGDGLRQSRRRKGTMTQATGAAPTGGVQATVASGAKLDLGTRKSDPGRKIDPAAAYRRWIRQRLGLKDVRTASSATKASLRKSGLLPGSASKRPTQRG